MHAACYWDRLSCSCPFQCDCGLSSPLDYEYEQMESKLLKSALFPPQHAKMSMVKLLPWLVNLLVDVGRKCYAIRCCVFLLYYQDSARQTQHEACRSRMMRNEQSLLWEYGTRCTHFESPGGMKRDWNGGRERNDFSFWREPANLLGHENCAVASAHSPRSSTYHSCIFCRNIGSIWKKILKLEIDKFAAKRYRGQYRSTYFSKITLSWITPPWNTLFVVVTHYFCTLLIMLPHHVLLLTGKYTKPSYILFMVWWRHGDLRQRRMTTKASQDKNNCSTTPCHSREYLVF